MTNEIQIFTNPEFGNVRTLTEADGTILFCGKDVAEALGYRKPYEAITAHCRCTVKRGIPHPQSPTKELELSFITEPDLYRLIVASKLPSAQKFERWVFEEVLPTIRKTGGYLTPEKVEEALCNPDVLIDLAQQIKQLQKQRAALESKVEADKPKVAFADAVTASDTDILVRDLAKLLRQNGYGVGEKRLFAQLRDEGYLIKAKPDKNRPTQRAMELGLFRVQERVIFTDAGEPSRTAFTTKVTPKGQQYFINRYCGNTH